ncbi:MAG TPA: acyl-CoA dehydrogenase family protein, partial [Steroidobacteraceae bacterium]|nr:acyl-CoA dehydrogenase family protein [Steroidobacteraceae bacterium]
TIEESLSELLPISRLHASTFESADTWSSLDDIGLFNITASEDAGGSGLGAVEEALIAVALGRGAVAPAVLATMGAAHVADASAMPARGQRIAAGYRRGDRVIVVDDEAPAFVLIREPAQAGLYQLDVAGSHDVDSHLWCANLRRPEKLGKQVGRADASRLLRLRLLDAAALAGLAQAATEMAVSYALQREQFGRPIGTFQAIKHHCANMAIAARCARDQTSFAAVAVDEGREDAALQVESALLVAGTSAVDNSGKNIQIHGGMGFSDEADPHLLVKRAQVLITLAGGLEACTARIADIKTTW